MGYDPFIGEIMMWGGNYAPEGWAFCDGAMMPISQNPALYSLIGTYYGGDGRTTFALPDMRGRVPIQWGQGPGLSAYQLGQSGGAETVTLQVAALPELDGDPAVNALAAPGGQGSINTMPPYLAVNFVIALQGIYPARQ